jgi:C1A family cysteine protease
MKTKRHYGWTRRDIPDQRDLCYAAPRRKVPDAVDQRPDFAGKIPVWDQTILGSCTAHNIGYGLMVDQVKQGLPLVMPSRLFIYYQERVLENSVDSDAGASIRDSVKAVAKFGYPDEKLWPYDVAKFARVPSQAAYADAKARAGGLVYQRVARTLPQLMGCLADGFPIHLGFSVYESFESDRVARTGVAPMPEPGEQLLGGHAVPCVGYDKAKGVFILRNSWGKDWGQKGYFTLPLAYLTTPSLSADFWKVTKTA